MEEQSPFANAQEQLQPPPELTDRRIKPEAAPAKKKWPWVLIGVIGLLAAVVILLAGMVWQQKNQAEIPAAPTPTFKPPPTSSPKESALQKLKAVVDEADPDKNPFPPPQVDMDVKF
jgi:hypothetical protein